MGERATCNREDVGSIPLLRNAGIAQLVERYFPKIKAGGSSPPFRSERVFSRRGNSPINTKRQEGANPSTSRNRAAGSSSGS